MVVLEEGFISVYRLEEDGGLLKEGAVRLSFRALRAELLKDRSGSLTARLCLHPLQGVYLGFCLLHHLRHHLHLHRFLTLANSVRIERQKQYKPLAIDANVSTSH